MKYSIRVIVRGFPTEEIMHNVNKCIAYRKIYETQQLYILPS